MDIEIFKVVFNNIVLRNLIFEYVRDSCQFDPYENKERFTWNQLIQLPFVLAGNGYLEQLKEYFKSGSIHFLTKMEGFRILRSAVLGGNLNIVKYILEQQRATHLCRNPMGNADVLTFAVQSKDENFEMVRFLCGLTDIKWHYEHALSKATLTQNIELVKFLNDRISATSKDYHIHLAIELAARVGRIDMIELLSKGRENVLSSAEVYHEAVSSSNIELLKYLKEKNVVYTDVGTWSAALMDVAAERGNLEILIWLNDNRIGSCTNAAIAKAAANGNLKIIQWLHHNRTEGCAPDAIDKASANGHLNIVQWLYHNRTEGFTSDSMDKAAKNGYLDVIKWLNQNTTASCTVRAMTDAAGEGYISLVKWLHENRSEGCTEQAMDQAAANGYLEMVMWLNENRSEGCSTHAMNMACYGGYLSIAQYLHENRSEGCTDAMDNAIRKGYQTIVEWMHANRTEGCSSAGAVIAEENGYPELAKWIRENRTECATYTKEIYNQQQYLAVSPTFLSFPSFNESQSSSSSLGETFPVPVPRCKKADRVIPLKKQKMPIK
ncbi:hypothetical protein PPL_06011 [Heterostelium album PN500]|uniref:Ankyrin repeat protein n=1 Tax=Heterostelium pallidum (strain ATCC 26659 / Pp 5 / PN500) TaxID=670386 RepID=D3BBZ1_HETP5|nr:hypothetical protein PPL_06011 [Heterostelium album PN500]EFA81174.1 hypothetical protein PPL_06011 [Heterostelium album PN500]|eukprot:XP_020433292.1 hypothetical protein PPL_06011 [Heterostelium album PN500]